MMISTETRTRLARRAVTKTAQQGGISLEPFTFDLAVAYLLGEYGGQTAALISANPYHAEMFLEKSLGLNVSRLWSTYDRLVENGERLLAAMNNY